MEQRCHAILRKCHTARRTIGSWWNYRIRIGGRCGPGYGDTKPYTFCNWREIHIIRRQHASQRDMGHDRRRHRCKTPQRDTYGCRIYAPFNIKTNGEDRHTHETAIPASGGVIAPASVRRVQNNAILPVRIYTVTRGDTYYDRLVARMLCDKTIATLQETVFLTSFPNERSKI